MRLHLLAASALTAGALIAAPLSAFAAKPKHPAATTPAGATPTAGAAGAQTDIVVAKVDGNPIHLSDLDAAVQELPQQMRSLPAQQLYPMLVDQLVDRQALVIAAKKQKLQNDPAVEAAIARATDQVLQTALLRRDVGPKITDATLHSMYDKEIGTKPGEQQVQASHILVATEAQAKDIITQLKAGADFATLAKKYSTDPTGAQNGGDLGFFKQGDMLPEFSAAAFALKDGEYTQTPVHTRYGYHVIKVFAHRLSPPPNFADAQPQLQQELVQMLVQQEVANAKQGMKIERFNSDGSPATGAPAAVPPPGSAPAAPAPAAAPSPAAPPK